MSELAEISGKQPRPKRRRQEDRSRVMRQRLIEATMECLLEVGYSDLSISKIVERAGVSRGAHLHHFESKAALIAAATEALYDRMAERTALTLGAPLASGRLTVRVIIERLWSGVILSPEAQIYLELLMASRTDPVLAERIAHLTPKLTRIYIELGQQFLQIKPGSPLGVAQLVQLTRAILRGMLLEVPALGGDARELPEIEMWIALLEQHLEAKN